MPRRPRIDVPRLAEALARPGQDPRTWTTAGRIDEDPDARLFDAGIGWLVDVTFYGSDVESDDGHPCRVLSQGAGDGAGEYIPPPLGAEVIVEFPGGDPDNGAVVVGYGSNEGGCTPPSSVNGLPIAADATASTPVAVSPYDTEFKVSPHNRREQYAGLLVLESPELRLGADSGTEKTLRGETTNANTNELIQALTQLATSLQGLVGPLTPLVAIGTALQTALQTLSPKISGQLSERVRVR